MTTPAAAGPAMAVTVRESDIRPFACWSRAGAYRLRDETTGGGAEERLCSAVDRGEHDEVPDLGPAGQQEDRHGGRGDAASDVGYEHDPLPRQPVGPDAGDEEQRDAGNRPGGEHVGEAPPQTSRSRAPRTRGR